MDRRPGGEAACLRQDRGAAGAEDGACDAAHPAALAPACGPIRAAHVSSVSSSVKTGDSTEPPPSFVPTAARHRCADAGLRNALPSSAKSAIRARRKQAKDRPGACFWSGSTCFRVGMSGPGDKRSDYRRSSGGNAWQRSAKLQIDVACLVAHTFTRLSDKQSVKNNHKPDKSAIRFLTAHRWASRSCEGGQWVAVEGGRGFGRDG